MMWGKLVSIDPVWAAAIIGAMCWLVAGIGDLIVEKLKTKRRG